MPFFTLGISHATAPVEIRERLSFGPDQLPDALRKVTQLPGVNEAVILSTCNRTEIHAEIEEGSETNLARWLTETRVPEDPEVEQRFYTHAGEDAARHLFRVACGLDSLILGEPQILGQIKDAYDIACTEQAVGTRLHRLFQYTFAVAKQVRSDTRIGENPVTVAYAAVRLARQIFADFDSLTALLIGAGETIELVARHLQEQGMHRMVIANRTLERAHHLAERLGAYAIGLGEIGAHIGEADIVIGSTGSLQPIVSQTMVAEALHGRKRRPMLMIDIAVPRDIEPAVAELDDIYLFTIDDLHQVVKDSLRSRMAAARDAETLIEDHVGQFVGQLHSLETVPLIRAVRERAESFRDRTLMQARQRLAHGESPEDVLRFLADTLTNRLLHAPTAYLRGTSQDDLERLQEEIRALFGIDRPED